MTATKAYGNKYVFLFVFVLSVRRLPTHYYSIGNIPDETTAFCVILHLKQG